MKTGSGATEHYEPREVRKEAAVNSQLWVPQVTLVRASWWRKARGQGQKWVHDPMSDVTEFEEKVVIKHVNVPAVLHLLR